MYKIELEPTYDYTIPVGVLDWENEFRNHVMASFLTDGMIIWLFDNVEGKYLVDGKYLYFQNGEDAMAFKLAWK